MEGRVTSLAIGVFGSVVVALAQMTPVQASETDPVGGQSDRVCHDVEVPTSAVPEVASRDQHIYGHLCLPKSGRSSVLQVLVPGYMYGSSYWDMPGAGAQYSYAGALNQAGYATLAIDPLGVGRSSHPPGTLLTENTLAAGVHDVVQAGHKNQLPGGPYDKVVSVGHSYGTAVTEVEAATYQDVDGTIATGAVHLEGAVGLAQLVGASHPAAANDRLRKQVPKNDPTYLTSRPGTRGDLFYAPGDSNSKVIKRDEETKQTATVGQLSTTPEYIVPTVTRSIDKPSLVVLGQQDKFFCAGAGGAALESCASSKALHDSESSFWSPEAEMQAYVLPKSGHSVNLANNAEKWYQRAIDWSRQYFPLR